MAIEDPSDDRSPGLVAKGFPGDNAAPLTISEISAELKRSVEERFGFVRLRGELSGVKRAASGHLYTCLKDDAAVIDGVMWRSAVQQLPFLPEDGLEVVASGKLTTYPGRSKYQIVIERMELAGEGALLALLEKTRARLAAEGLFDRARKRPLPFLPVTIGVVTSPTGAVIRDILHRLADRFPSRVIVWPVLVQGPSAAGQVAAAIEGFSALAQDHPHRPDLLIVARGGGSIEDLWSFNEEVVVRAIAACSIPTISAVGHETDTTLADHAADHRAPTPTAAAEMAVPVLADLAASLADYRHRQQRCALRPIATGRERLEARVGRLPRPEALLQVRRQQLDDLAERLRRGLLDRAAAGRDRLSRQRLSPAYLQRHVREAERALAAQPPLRALVRRRMKEGGQRLAALARVMRSLDPDAVLQRGFVRVTDDAGRTLTSRSAADKARHLALKFRDGDLAVDVRGSGSPPRARTRSAARLPSGTQEDLFGRE